MTKLTYTWRCAYIRAVLELDPQLKFVKICEAVAAIEQRRLSPVESADERLELEHAEEGVKVLIAEFGMKPV
jgi:hypothetical protein